MDLLFCVFFKFATTVVVLWFTELMLHLSHANQKYSQTIHLSQELKSCIQIKRRWIDLMETPQWKLLAGAKIRVEPYCLFSLYSSLLNKPINIVRPEKEARQAFGLSFIFSQHYSEPEPAGSGLDPIQLYSHLRKSDCKVLQLRRWGGIFRDMKTFERFSVKIFVFIKVPICPQTICRFRWVNLRHNSLLLM